MKRKVPTVKTPVKRMGKPTIQEEDLEVQTVERKISTDKMCQECPRCTRDSPLKHSVKRMLIQLIGTKTWSKERAKESAVDDDAQLRKSLMEALPLQLLLGGHWDWCFPSFVDSHPAERRVLKTS